MTGFDVIVVAAAMPVAKLRRLRRVPERRPR